MAHAVTYLELYFRRLEVLRRLYNQQSEPGSSRDVGVPGERRATPKARSEVASSTHHVSETVSAVELSGHVQSPEAVSTLMNSGLISAHVPERVTTTADDGCGPFRCGQQPQAYSAIPQSPSAVKRLQKRQQPDHFSDVRSKIPRHPMPYDAWAIRSHPLALGVIKLCQAEEGDARNRKSTAGSRTKGKKRGCREEPGHADTQPISSDRAHGLPERELSFTDSLSLTGDFLRPPPSMYCTLTSEDMLLQHMHPHSRSGA